MSVLEAARYYAKHVLAYKTAPPLNDIVKRLIADAEKDDRRDRTIDELHSRLESFAEDFANRQLIDLTTEEIEDWLDEEHWPHNGLRHSFGSYHLADFGDQMKTAAQMGHRDSSVIHNHYKALVLKAEAEKYWKLSPEVVNEEDQENEPKTNDPDEVKP